MTYMTTLAEACSHQAAKQIACLLALPTASRGVYYYPTGSTYTGQWLDDLQD